MAKKTTAGGFGVFDPGINAFSIATKIFPGTLLVSAAELSFPDGADTPIAAEIEFASSSADGPLRCSLDWRRSAGAGTSGRRRSCRASHRPLSGSCCR